MSIEYEYYRIQEPTWPQNGRHIMAQYDDDTIIVYQAYKPSIAKFAVKHQFFGGDFKYTRMSWIKPNFLWMMYRCGWAAKEGQEAILAVRMQRNGFDQILAEAVHSSYKPWYGQKENWQAAVVKSQVRLQWDPDHDPYGAKQDRRAIQLGLRDDFLKRYSREWIVEIENVTPFVLEQAKLVRRKKLDELMMPKETSYEVLDQEVRDKLQIGNWE